MLSKVSKVVIPYKGIAWGQISIVFILILLSPSILWNVNNKYKSYKLHLGKETQKVYLLFSLYRSIVFLTFPLSRELSKFSDEQRYFTSKES